MAIIPQNQIKIIFYSTLIIIFLLFVVREASTIEWPKENLEDSEDIFDRTPLINEEEKLQCINHFSSNMEKMKKILEKSQRRESDEEELEVLGLGELPIVIPGVIRVIATALNGNISGIAEESYQLFPGQTQQQISSILQLITDNFNRVNEAHKVLQKSTPKISLSSTTHIYHESESESTIKETSSAQTTFQTTLSTKATDEIDDSEEVTKITTPRDVLENIRVILFENDKRAENNSSISIITNAKKLK